GRITTSIRVELKELIALSIGRQSYQYGFRENPGAEVGRVIAEELGVSDGDLNWTGFDDSAPVGFPGGHAFAYATISELGRLVFSKLVADPETAHFLDQHCVPSSRFLALIAKEH
ncbi:unnamed protein product, partial [Amoebophrya sp. A25]